MATLEEKQRELDALQTAFDEYIVSSRELEEELDAELTKCQNDLTKAESRNTALANQLANIQPQLNSMEAKVSTLTTQLSTESQRRISSEMKSEEAESKMRELEGTLAAVRSSELKKLKEENEELCERLAFVEGEAMDYRNELDTERERHREEIEEVRGDVHVLNMRLKEREEEIEELLIKVEKEAGNGSTVADSDNVSSSQGSNVEEKKEGEDDVMFDGEEDEGAGTAEPPQDIAADEAGTPSEEHEEYIKTLEDELEIVTDKLIEAETKLSQTEAELEEALIEAEQAKADAAAMSEAASADAKSTQNEEKIAELESSIQQLQEENAALQDESKRIKEELDLALEELALSKEELEAYEEDRREQATEFDAERKKHREEVTLLKTQLDTLSSEGRSHDIEAKSWEEALVSSKKETQILQEEVDRLEVALTNSKADQESLQEEIEELKAAFDETATREKSESEGQHAALEELLATRSREVDELKEEVYNLTETNNSLNIMLKDMETNLQRQASEIERQQKHVANASASSSQELQDAQDEIHALEGFLEVAKKELEEQKNEVAKVRASLQEKIVQAQDELNVAEEELGRTRSQLEKVEEERERNESAISVAKLEDQNRMSISMKNHLEDEVKQLRAQLAIATSTSTTTTKEEPVQDDAEDATNIDELLQSNDPVAIANEVRSMAKKVAAQKSHNAELLTKILKLQGNIQVCCRIRPMSVEESQRGLHEVAQSLSETEVGCFDERTRSWKSYAFDKVWGPENRQRDVFGDVEPMALSVIDGYNACIFAYGQTGSGKTYTMEGSNGQHGISQRTLQKIFNLLQDKAQQHQHRAALVVQDDGSQTSLFEYKIEVGMLEIYNDDVYDLLDPGFASTDIGTPRKKALDIRHGVDGTVEVQGLIKESVNSVSDVLNALDRGNSNRAKASTNLNEHSSRSHMVLRVDVTSGVGEAKNKGSLYLVDLAGSERVRKSEVEGKALKEAQHINKSLSALGNVMEALDRKSSHIPYRDSKLTHLLQNSLGGNSRTMMVVTICPHNDSYDETTFALKFATRVRRINLGSAQKNVMAKNLEETVKNLTSEMSLLSKAKERSESQLLALKREKERVEDKLSKASANRSNSKEEMRTLAVLRQTNNDVTARWQKEKIIREEKAAELGKVQEELQRVQRDLRNTKRQQESLTQQNEDKENTIFQLKKDLRSVKEQLNEEKIRHRRSQVMQSRIPPPTRSPKASTTRKPLSKPTGLMKPSARATEVKRQAEASSRANTANRSTNDQVKRGDTLDEHKNTLIRSRIVKMLQERKLDNIDNVLAKYEGRETELLEKLMSQNEGGTKESKPPSTASTAELTVSTISSNDDRPRTRQDMALERHMARMKRIRASSNK